MSATTLVPLGKVAEGSRPTGLGSTLITSPKNQGSDKAAPQAPPPCRRSRRSFEDLSQSQRSDLRLESETLATSSPPGIASGDGESLSEVSSVNDKSSTNPESSVGDCMNQSSTPSNLSDTSSTEELGNISLPTDQGEVREEDFEQEGVTDINRKLLDMFDQVAEANRNSSKESEKCVQRDLQERISRKKGVTEVATNVHRTPSTTQTISERRGEEKTHSKSSHSGNSSMISPTCVAELGEVHHSQVVDPEKERLRFLSTSDANKPENVKESHGEVEKPMPMEGGTQLCDEPDRTSNKPCMEGTVIPMARRQNANATSQGDAPERPSAPSNLVSAAKSPSCPSVVQHPAMSRLQDFVIHDDLQLQLSQPTVNRVSFYGVIHDINKEAASMAAEDHSAFHKLSTDSDGQQITDRGVGASAADAALIDEEEWLLSAIASRSREETSLLEKKSESAASFAYAVGDSPDDANPHDCAPEKTGGKPSDQGDHGDKPNPIGEINGSSRTRLWKPSRSWWEARSGKNPWIDPESHVKRWRYLWPLIHYHKFLARCIKKLKRHGVTDFLGPDSSPVISFLRHEIIAISDHLACCSNFTSESWLAALQHFSGWHQTSPEAQECLSVLVARQKLRSFADPSDVKSSPLLRKVLNNSNFFAPPAKMDGSGRNSYGGRKPNRGASWNRPMSSAMGHGVYAYPMPHNNFYYQQHLMMQNYYVGPLGPQGEVVPPRQARGKHTKSTGTKDAPPSMRGYRGKSKQHNGNRVGPSFHVPAPGYHGYTGHYNYHMPQPMHMSMQQPSHDAYYTGQLHQPVAGSVYHPPGVVSNGPSSPVEYSSNYVVHGAQLSAPHNSQHIIHEHQEVCNQQTYYPSTQVNMGGNERDVTFAGDSGNRPGEEHPADAASGYGPHGDASATPPSFCSPPPLPSRAAEFQCPVPCVSASPTPVQHLHSETSVPPSPYWGHLDQVALAVTLGCDASFVDCGRTTPAKSRQNTPKRLSSKRRNKRHGGKPLLLNPFAAQQHCRPVHGGMVLQPPSPATQFLMSPQANSEAAAFYTVPDAVYEQHCNIPNSGVSEGPARGVISPSVARKIDVNVSGGRVEESGGLATPRDLRSELASHVENEAEANETEDVIPSEVTS